MLKGNPSKQSKSDIKGAIRSATGKGTKSFLQSSLLGGHWGRDNENPGLGLGNLGHSPERSPKKAKRLAGASFGVVPNTRRPLPEEKRRWSTFFMKKSISLITGKSDLLYSNKYPPPD